MDLVQEVQLQIDETRGPVFWVIDQLYDAINASILEVSLNLKDYQRTSTNIVLSSGQDLVTLPETSIMIPQFVVYDGIKIFPTTTAQLQDWSNNWKNESPSRPNWLLLWDANHVRLFPRSNGTYTFALHGVPVPTEIADGTHNITGLDTLVRNAIVMRAAGKLLEFTQPQLADAKMMEAEEFEKRFARQNRNMFGDNIERLRPATAWDLAQQGDIKVGRLFMGNQS